MDVRQGSTLARWLGVLKLSRRQLQQRWLESVLIVLGIALGVGVLTAGETFVRFQQAQVATTISFAPPSLRAVSVAPRRLDFAESFFGLESVAAVRVTPDMLEEPVQMTLEDVLVMHNEMLGTALVTTGTSSSWSLPIVTVGGEAVAEGAEMLTFPVAPDEFAFQNAEFVAGASFSWDDFGARLPRIVLEASSVARMFPGLEPAELLGQTVVTTRDSGVPWQVVGVVTLADDSEIMLRSRLIAESPNTLVAFSPASVSLAQGAAMELTFSQLYIAPHDEAVIPDLIAEVEAYFNQKYGAGRVDVRSPLAAREMLTGELGPFVVALLVLAGLGLVIAAVNVLNLFTARVLRRQRITGMSVALGATRQLLFWQTAGEALLLGAVGSVLGLGVAAGLVGALRGFLISAVAELGALAHELYGGFQLTGADVLVGLVAGIGLSLIFGLYPAWLGARQNPVEALRVE